MATGENEAATAHALVAQLSAVGLDARAHGSGVHWHVDVGPVAPRALRVHCFWYERAIPGLLLGMNPANARSRLRGTRKPSDGPEYLVILHDDGVQAADGRTHDMADVVACARAWLARAELDQLVQDIPFVDKKRRAMRALAERIDPRLRRDIGGDPAYGLWVYGDGRSCEVVADDDAIACKFLLGQAQVAYAARVADVAAAIAGWLVDRLALSAFARRVPGVELEAHAEVLETDPARWHWLHLRDRIADPDDVLAPLRDLIQRLASSPVASRFFSYSSLNRLCFSASSHYPWVDDGLPVVAPAGSGTYLVGDTRCYLARAVQLVEAMLKAYPIQPFFGSAPHHEIASVAESLARQGRALSPQLVQRGAWYELVVSDTAETKRCIVSGRHVAFIDASGQLRATWPTLDDAVCAIVRYCEGDASLAELGRTRR